MKTHKPVSMIKQPSGRAGGFGSDSSRIPADESGMTAGTGPAAAVCPAGFS